MTDKTEKKAGENTTNIEGAGENTTARSVASSGAGALDASGKATMSPVTDTSSPSGALQEPEALTADVLDHPAVDNNPREDTTQNMNRVDFNDPSQGDQAAVIENLGLEPLGEDERPEASQRTSLVVDGSRKTKRG